MKIIGRSEESFSKEEIKYMDDYYEEDIKFGTGSFICVIILFIALICVIITNVYHQITTTGDFSTMANTNDSVIKIFVDYKFKCDEDIDIRMLETYGRSHLYGDSPITSNLDQIGIIIKRDMNSYIHKTHLESFNFRKCAVYKVNVK